MEILSQLMILLCGASSVHLVARKDKWKKYGYVVGLTAQPFWLYTTYMAEQWGIFILSFWYAYNWGLGIYNYIIKEDKE